MAFLFFLPKRIGLVQWLRSLPVCVDVVCLQETHCTSASECSAWFRSSGFTPVVSPGSAHSCGCIVLFHPSLSLVNSWDDSDGRFLQCEFSLHAKLFRVCCIYCPNCNPAWDHFLDRLYTKIDPSVPTILSGDFNTIFDRLLDRAGSDPTDSSRESSSSLLNLFDSCCVIDIWKYLHPSASGFTWTRWNGSLASRIDLIGVRYVWVPSVLCCEIVPCPFSDHCGVSLSIAVLDVVPPGPGLWKFNTSVLKDEDYVKLITDAWFTWHASIPRFPSLAKWWEKGKSLIKGLTIRFCCDRSTTCSKNRDLLVCLNEHLKVKVDACSVSCLAPYQGVLKLLSLTWKSLGVPKCAPVLDGSKTVRRPRPPSFTSRRMLRTNGSPHYGRVMGPSYPLLSICVAPLPLFILPFSLPRLLTPLFLPLSLPIYHLLFHLSKLLSVRAILLLKSVLQLFKEWPGAKPLDLMASQWSYI